MLITRRATAEGVRRNGRGHSRRVWAAYGFLDERHALGHDAMTLPVAGLPPALAGLRIGLLTDIHRSRWVSAEDVERGVSALMAAQPDLIVLGGDYVTWGDRQIRRAVGRSARRGSTHRTASSASSATTTTTTTCRRHLSARHVQMLKDARTDLGIRGETLSLAGMRFWTRRAADIAPVIKGAHGTVVLLAHDPRRLTEAAALKIPLVLSGHTHGGQVVLPAVGAIAAQKFPVVAGMARQQDTTIFVSRGLGTVYVPIRVNCPPEVAVLTLQPA